MKIQYLRDAPQGKAGDIAQVTGVEGNVLVKIGFAKPVVEYVPVKAPRNALLNLNGIAVVDDFGEIALKPRAGKSKGRA